MKLASYAAMILLASVSLAACQQKSSGTNAGQSCHVVGGDNAGKQGRYDQEGACCDADASGEEVPGGWGCTECTGLNKDKCKDGPKPLTQSDVVAPEKAGTVSQE